MNKKELKLFYGPNGSGKTTLARYLATKNKGLHIQLDLFSSMHRGKNWHTRKNNRDKINLLLGLLQSAITNTNYRKYYIDGVIIYPFMFKMIENWCLDNKIIFEFIKLTGDEEDLKYRVKQRSIKVKKDWNMTLPELYKNFTYRKSIEINTTGKSLVQVVTSLTQQI